jgi:arylsulfatase A-like enzyme
VNILKLSWVFFSFFLLYFTNQYSEIITFNNRYNQYCFFLLIVFIFLFITEKQPILKNIEKKLHEICHLLIILFFFIALFLIISTLLRFIGILIYSSEIGVFNKLVLGVMYDINFIKSFENFFVLYFMINMIFIFFLKDNLYKDFVYIYRNMYIGLAIILILSHGYLWAWVEETHRFVGLEFLYIRNIPTAKFNYLFIFVSIFFLCLFFLIFKFLVNKLRFKINRFFSLATILLFPSVLFFLNTQIFALTVNLSRMWMYEPTDSTDSTCTSDSSAKTENNYLALNPISFLFDNSISEIRRVKSFDKKKTLLPFFQRSQQDCSSEDKNRLAQKLLGSNEFIQDINFPAHRLRIQNRLYPQNNYNIVMIVLESFETNDNSSFDFTDQKPLKFLEKLKKDSLYFENCFANAQASYEGETALSMSLPVWGIVNGKQDGIYYYSQKKAWLSLLKENNYQTYFLTSWDPGTPITLTGKSAAIAKRWLGFNIPEKVLVDCYTCPFVLANIENISPLFTKDLVHSEKMYDSIIHLNDLEASKRRAPWNHGEKYVHDEFTYEKLYNKITSMTDPFFIVTHTGSSHYNYPLPEGAKQSNDLSLKERYYSSIKYADTALENFFERIKTHPIYNNTIFVIVSDHTSYAVSKKDRVANVSLYDQYHIPALIHAPGILEHRIVKDPSYQIDLGPTILDILNLSGHYTAFGTALTGDKIPDRCMILPDFDGYFIAIKGKYIARVRVDNVIEIYDYVKDKHKNLIEEDEMKIIIKEFHNDFLDAYSLYADTIYCNKLIPKSRNIK